ncbi:MAG: HlyC/CorC family transporter [Sterolibacteriaceae bacterium]|nr:HlyC/CorC family transporter [Sterolibacteriaceae bacterium]MBK9085241.1 HlyC/CorC family transporter [Sterolibacteriaceae bacterium]
MEIPLLLGLIVLNGLFAMSEIALLTARKARLQKLAEEGDRSSVFALRLAEDPTRFLSTIQIGITSISILNGIVGEAILARPLALWLQSLGAQRDASEIGATALVVIVITYLSIVLGELVPKRLGQISPEPIARIVARPMLWLAILGKPFVKLLSTSTNLVLRLLGARASGSNAVTEEEIHAMLAEGSNAGVIEHHEHAMVRNVFRLDDRQIASLMIPRADIVYLDVDDPIEINLRKIETAVHTRFPVCKGGLSDVLGMVSAKQLLTQTIRGEKPALTANLQPAVFVPESLTGMELLDNFRSTSMQSALVIDEYGEIQGLVTVRDVLEAITGEFKPPNLEDAWAIQRADGSWLLDGLIPVPELKDRLGLRQVPEEEKGRYNALSGMLMLLLGRVPQTTDHAEWEGWRFEVIDMDGKRVDKVLASRVPGAAEAASAAKDDAA